MASTRPKALRTNPADACWLLGEESRWKIVLVLLDGQPRTIRDLTPLAHRGRDAVSKHVHLMVANGLLRRSEKKFGDRRMEYFELAPEWRVEGEPRTLDFGECQVRFGPRERPAEKPSKVETIPVKPVRQGWGKLPKRI